MAVGAWLLTLGGAPIVFSYDGPVTHVAAYCSPCVPGAADLNSGPGDIACHGVPEDWLEDDSRIDIVGQNGNTAEHYEVKS